MSTKNGSCQFRVVEIRINENPASKKSNNQLNLHKLSSEWNIIICSAKNFMYTNWIILIDFHSKLKSGDSSEIMYFSLILVIRFIYYMAFCNYPSIRFKVGMIIYNSSWPGKPHFTKKIISRIGTSSDNNGYSWQLPNQTKC